MDTKLEEELVTFHPILCIPRVYLHITEKKIRKTLNELNMGILERIDLVTKKTEKGEYVNRAFIHYKQWNQSKNAMIAKERLFNGKEIKIMYDEPWFWKISLYKEPEQRYLKNEKHK